jgi:O-acetyl-ADP-ribose deacetylase (regulator of RNase III)
MSAERWTVLAFAVVALVTGSLLALARGHRPGLPRSRNRQVLAWLVLSLGPTLLLFLFFPDSFISGEFGWGQAGGAIGAFLIIWLLGVRNALKADDLERREAELEDRERRSAPGLVVGPTSPAAPVAGGKVQLYELRKGPRRMVGIVPGGIDQVRFADMWVNSENTNMQMARYYDRSISGAIRYLGARHDEANEVTEDVIGAALAEKVRGRRTVPVGSVYDTGPGELARTHGVKVVLHVAAAVGQFRLGYAPAGDLGLCVRQALECGEKLAENRSDMRSMVVPLLGSGTARGDLNTSAEAVLDAAVDHLENHTQARISTVYFLAFTEAERTACERVLRADPRLKPGARIVGRAALRATGARA